MSLTKVVLSPCLVELMTKSENEMAELAHLTHLQSILNFLMPLNVEFDLYENAPYYPDSVSRPPISRYHYHSLSCTQIYAKIQRKICYAPEVSLGECTASKLVSEYDYPEDSETKDSFLRYITYLFSNDKKTVMFIGEANRNKRRPYIFEIPSFDKVEVTPISDPADDCSQQIANIVTIERNHELFPNARMCTSLNDSFLRRRNIEDRISLIKEVGAEVASRNGYAYRKDLSSINTKKQGNTRVIYSRFDGILAFLSLDFESGGFEVFDQSGIHLGQYSFSGKKVKQSSPRTHKLFFN